MKLDTSTPTLALHYVTPWATPQRSSHVPLPMRRYETLAPVGPAVSNKIDYDTIPPNAFILPMGPQVLVVHASAFSMIDAETGTRAWWEEMPTGLK